MVPTLASAWYLSLTDKFFPVPVSDGNVLTGRKTFPGSSSRTMWTSSRRLHPLLRAPSSSSTQVHIWSQSAPCRLTGFAHRRCTMVSRPRSSAPRTSGPSGCTRHSRSTTSVRANVATTEPHIFHPLRLRPIQLISAYHSPYITLRAPASTSFALSPFAHNTSLLNHDQPQHASSSSRPSNCYMASIIWPDPLYTFPLRTQSFLRRSSSPTFSCNIYHTMHPTYPISAFPCIQKRLCTPTAVRCNSVIDCRSHRCIVTI